MQRDRPQLQPGISWGHGLWIFLHTMAACFPETPTQLQQNQMNHFLWSLRFVMPCERCRAHYALNLQRFPPNLMSRYTLSRWLFDLHNIVNQHTHKPLIQQFESVLRAHLAFEQTRANYANKY